MANEAEPTIHTMPLAALRARAAEARRVLAQARAIARSSFDAEGPQNNGAEAPRRVGLLLDAAQRLLPGMPPLADARARSSRSKPRESSWRRVTLRGGEGKAMDTIERAEILDAVADDAAGLVAEIERRSSTVFRTTDPSEEAASRRR
jgi:hypothetical protein